jgi:hypothetical protein
MFFTERGFLTGEKESGTAKRIATDMRETVLPSVIETQGGHERAQNARNVLVATIAGQN